MIHMEQLEARKAAEAAAEAAFLEDRQQLEDEEKARARKSNKKKSKKKKAKARTPRWQREFIFRERW